MKSDLKRKFYSIKNRCYNKNDKSYKWYGMIGIVMCEEWKNDFKAFEKWALENGYEKGLEIDRKDNSISYCPENCHFIHQSKNKAIGKLKTRSDCKSGYTGVYKSGNLYSVRMFPDKKAFYLNGFKTLEEAVKARIDLEIQYFGEQRTNFHFKEGD